MKKTIVINLNVVMAWLIVALIVTGLTATVGYYLGAFSYWPTEVKQLQPVVLADGQTAIEMTCRDVPGSFMQLFGTSDERVVKYYTLDGSEWLMEDFSRTENLDELQKALQCLHRQWLHDHKPQIRNADAVTVD